MRAALLVGHEPPAATSCGTMWWTDLGRSERDLRFQPHLCASSRDHLGRGEPHRCACGADAPLSPCNRCGARPGTLKWVGEGGAIALVHGAYVMYCERCAVVEQIEHAERVAARLPDLRRQLAEMPA